MEEFEELTKKWISIEKQARELERKIFSPKEYPKENQIKSGIPDKEYDWLILPGGLVPFYSIIIINALKPKKVYFIGTEEFKEGYLDEIVKETSLNPSQYIIDTVDYDEMDVSDVYEKILSRISLFKNKSVVLDLTRGKRIMGVGAGIVGAFFGFDLVYIDEKWNTEINKAVPGTHKLVMVKNPFSTFGDIRKREARELFNNYNYGASLFIYNKLEENIQDPRKIIIEKGLSEVYLHWNAFNFKAAFHKMGGLLLKSQQFNIKLKQEVKENAEMLKLLNSIDLNDPKSLNDESALHIIIDLYVNAHRKAERAEFEDSISRLYRVLELISQHKLQNHGIETSKPNIPQHQEEYKKITREMYGIEKNLPLEIGLKDGYILLFILKDSIVENETIEDLKKMFGVIRARDTSIIAHGLNLAGEKAFLNMDRLAKKFIQRICKEQNKDMGSLIKKHTFIKL